MRVLVTGIKTERHLSDFMYDVLDYTRENMAEISLFDNRGCDSLAQSYLASKNYKAVTVLTKNAFPSVNAAGWKHKIVRDLESLVSRIDCAYIVWDGQDKEIFDLIFALLKNAKPVKIYLTGLGRIKNITSKRELHLIGSIA